MVLRRPVVAWMVLGICGVVPAGCSGRRPTTFAAAVGRAEGPRVAEVGGQPIYGGDVRAQMRRTGLGARAALDQLVTFELVARAAAEAGTTPGDSADSDAVRALEVQRLIEREIEPRLAKDAISDAEVRALYDKGKARFVHERQVQVVVLCVFTGARMKAPARARAEANARAMKAFVDHRPDRAAVDFEAISKMPEWTMRNISFTTVWQGEDEPFPPVVGRAVAALRQPGDTTDLVGDETGYYLARYVAERPPENVSFAQAAPGLRDQMFEPWRRQRFLQLAAEFTRGHDIAVDPQAVDLLSEHASVP